MARVNKASWRTAFEALKTRYAALCADGKMTPEGRDLVDTLLTLFELLLAVVMEKLTPKGPQNSGLPSSRTEADDRARQHPGAKGKGPQTETADDSTRRLVAETHTAPVNACRACGGDLKHIDPTDHERYDQSQAENRWLLAHRPLRCRLLPHLRLLAVHGATRLQSPHRHQPRTQRQRRHDDREIYAE